MTTEPFREEIRYEYPLTPDSVVLDCGGYEGTFAEEISRRYDCHVHVLEPVSVFFDRAIERLKNKPKVTVYLLGIGGKTEAVQFHIKGNMTGAFTGEGEEERVMLMSPYLLLNRIGRETIDLLKLNIEGSEFDVLETILNEGLTKRFRNIQVQFHGGPPDAEARYDAIRTRLAETHELTFDYGWTWQNWRLKE